MSRNGLTRQEVYDTIVLLPVEERRSDILLEKMQADYPNRKIVRQTISECIISLKSERRIDYKIVRKKGVQYALISVL